MNVPHSAGRVAVELMMEQMGFGATLLRHAYFMNNDVTIKDEWMGGDKGYKSALLSTLKRTRELLAEGRL
ncbi:hypothetical protein LXT21_33070 [Myxococcus sp. K38C18041901]|uniref:hypothetical protein n=1 Tax=Myxococcus guangdongensis TaxID=2906760 RepID=UPI0020A77830|nr:hypothetical protein [Myxococcus guangdongensis]MCP3063618.1 hypothetical protein [Myxococcus guangdongensis]